MDLYEQFEVFDAMPGIRPQTVRGREKSTGRDVLVHLLDRGNEATRLALGRLSPEKRAQLVAEGEDAGGVFVVTSPAVSSLREWLGEGDTLQRTGKWDVTKLGMKTMADTPPKSAPGEFTRMFQSPGPEGEPTVAMDPPTAPPPVPPPGKRSPLETPALPKGWVLTKVIETPGGPTPPAGPPPSGAGEFTRMFQAPAAGAPEPPAPPPSPSAGEFTQMFQAPSAAKPAPPPQPVEAPSGGGEFTRMFQAPPSAKPAPPPPAQKQSEPPPPTSSGGGEFTRMFQAPAGQPSAPPKPTPPPASSGPGEFTRMFNAPPPSNAGVARPPQPAPPGEFNDLLQGNRNAGGQGGEFTRIFGKGQAPAPEAPGRSSAPPSLPKQGAGDFTRMFEAPAQPPPPNAPAAPPPATPAPQFQAPQFQAPQVQAPQFQAPQYQPPQFQPPAVQAPQIQPPQIQPPQIQAPQIQAPQIPSGPAPAKPATNYLPLVLILVGLLLVAVMMAVYFAMRK